MAKIVIIMKDNRLEFERDDEVALEIVDDLLKTTKKTPEKVSISIEKLPKRNQIEKFIKKQPKLKHDIGMISLHFLGQELSYSRENSRVMDVLYHRIKRARKDIEKKTDGVWRKRFIGGAKRKTYWFEKE